LLVWLYLESKLCCSYPEVNILEPSSVSSAFPVAVPEQENRAASSCSKGQQLQTLLKTKTRHLASRIITAFFNDLMECDAIITAMVLCCSGCNAAFADKSFGPVNDIYRCCLSRNVCYQRSL